MRGDERVGWPGSASETGAVLASERQHLRMGSACRRSVSAALLLSLRCEDNTVPDPTGADLRDANHTWEAARSMARNLMTTQIDAAVN